MFAQAGFLWGRPLQNPQLAVPTCPLEVYDELFNDPETE
jgi:hypothetical protein